MENTNQNEQKQTGFSKNKFDRKKIMGIIAYIAFFIPLLTDDKNDPFVKYHVKQSLVLFILSIIVWLISEVMPVFGVFIGSILNIGVLILLVIGVYNVIEGVEKPLPIIGKYASKFKF